MPTVNQELFNRGVRHAVFLERLKAGEARQIRRLLVEDVWPDILAQLTRRLERIRYRGIDTGVATTQRLRDMMAAINGLVSGGVADSEKLLTAHLEQLAITEAQFQVGSISSAVPSELQLRYRVPNLRTLQAVVRTRPMQGRFLRDWWRGVDVSLRGEIRGAINRGMAEGLTVPQMVQSVRAVSDIGRRRADLVVRTAVTHVSNAARDLTYQDNADLVREWQFVATLDLRTTLECIGLDGNTYAVGRGPRPPRHPRCRSTTIPVLASWRQLGLSGLPPEVRESMDGVVPAKQTYLEWLRGRSVAEQNEVLGTGRAVLFRAGKLPQRRLLDSTFTPLSLEQLRVLEGVA